eukprot:gene12442-biopygen7313
MKPLDFEGSDRRGEGPRGPGHRRTLVSPASPTGPWQGSRSASSGTHSKVPRPRRRHPDSAPGMVKPRAGRGEAEGRYLVAARALIASPTPITAPVNSK